MLDYQYLSSGSEYCPLSKDDEREKKKWVFRWFASLAFCFWRTLHCFFLLEILENIFIFKKREMLPLCVFEVIDGLLRTSLIFMYCTTI